MVAGEAEGEEERRLEANFPHKLLGIKRSRYLPFIRLVCYMPLPSWLLFLTASVTYNENKFKMQGIDLF